ncbi:MAG: radical SAM protein [Microgenomates group bacterium]
MNILIVNPPSSDKTINRDMAGGLGYSGGEGVVLPPIDLLNSAATLIKKKYGVYFVDAIAESIDDFGYFEKYMVTHKIDLVLCGMALPTLTEDTMFVRKLIDKYKNIRVIIKTGISYRQILEKALWDSGAERILFGECDLTIHEYVEKKRNTASIYLSRGKVVFEPITIEDRIKNLDDLPISARELTKSNLYKYVLLPGVVTTMQTSRGCPYPCGFYCPYPLVQGKAWRAMSNHRIILEIKNIVDLGIRSILFRDATFTLDNKRTEELCQLIIKNKLKFDWWCETRINVLTPELLKIMKKAGCMGINVGVETLDQELIIYQGKPGVSLDAVTKIRQTALEVGVKLHFLMIIGLPDENLRTMSNTFEYLVKLNPESVGFSTITPYPGTEMFDDALKNGLIEDFDWNKFNGNTSNMKTKYLSSVDMIVLRKMLLGTAFAMKLPKIISWPIIFVVLRILWVWKKLRHE